jgi:hypothetical protein
VPQTRLRRLNSDEVRSMQLFQQLSSPIQGVGDRRGPSDEERLPTGVESASNSVRDDDEVLGGYGSDISIQIRDDGQDFDLGGYEDFIYDDETALRPVGPPPPGQNEINDPVEEYADLLRADGALTRMRLDRKLWVIESWKDGLIEVSSAHQHTSELLH